MVQKLSYITGGQDCGVARGFDHPLGSVSQRCVDGLVYQHHSKLSRGVSVSGL